MPCRPVQQGGARGGVRGGGRVWGRKALHAVVRAPASLATVHACEG